MSIKRIRRDFSISSETDKKIRELAKKTGLKMSTIIDQAIEKFNV